MQTAQGVVQVPAQDVARYIEAMAEVSQARRGEIWEYCKVYKETLQGLIGGTEEAQELAVMQLLARVASGFASERRAEEVEDFFRGVLPGVLPQFAAEAVGQVRANVAAREWVVRGTCEYLQALGLADYSGYGVGYGYNAYGYDGYAYEYLVDEPPYDVYEYDYGSEETYII